MTIMRIRSTPGGHDEYGDPVTSTEATCELHGCAVAPRTTADTKGRARGGVVEGLTLYCPPGTDLVATDAVEVSGVRYRIDGEVGVWSSPFGGDVGGLEVALTRAAG